MNLIQCPTREECSCEYDMAHPWFPEIAFIQGVCVCVCVCVCARAWVCVDECVSSPEAMNI